MKRVLVVDDSSTVRRAATGTLRQSGYDVETAPDGRAALERILSFVPHVVLLDYFMPHMSGEQVVIRMREVANVQNVPVVFMSARPETFDESFMRRTGAVDAIAKPFRPEVLLHVIGKVLSREERAPAELTWNRSEVVQDKERKARLDRAAYALSTFLAELGIESGPNGAAITPKDILRDLTQAKLESLTSKLVAETTKLSLGSVTLLGDVSEVPVGEVLQLFSHQQQTGTLEVRSGQKRCLISFRKGLIDLALGSPTERPLMLGRYLEEDGVISASDLNEFLNRRGNTELRMGSQLVRLGYITREELTRALTRQTSELVYEVLRWTEGGFRFRRYWSPKEAVGAELGLPVSAILMEGLRRVDEWRLIEEQLRDPDRILVPRPEPIEAMGEQQLSAQERMVLRSLTGTRSIREVISLTKMNPFDTCKVLFSLLSAGLVRQRRPTQPPSV